MIFLIYLMVKLRLTFDNECVDESYLILYFLGDAVQ